MKQKKQQTNIDVVTGIMKWGNPMKQIWVMNALMEAAKKDAFAPAPDWGDNSMINGDAWKAAAVEIYSELKAAGYGG